MGLRIHGLSPPSKLFKFMWGGGCTPRCLSVYLFLLSVVLSLSRFFSIFHCSALSCEMAVCGRAVTRRNGGRCCAGIEKWVHEKILQQQMGES